ncbi:MAG: 2-oxoacid:acceptor oxidoreductase subunit alpha, partial [Acidimicrobiales bacterium]
KYRTPVILLSDGYLANGSEPWLLPDIAELADISTEFATGPNAIDESGQPVFHPYARDPDTLAREWALPGTPGLEHRIGGLEKADVTGNVSYDPLNHEHMVRLRAQKIAGIAKDIAPIALDDETGDAEVLVLGWGSTYGAIAAAVRRVRALGHKAAHAHLTHLNPFPANLGEILAGYEKVIVAEGNLGQLARLVRAEFLVDAKPLTKVQGRPFRVAEIEHAIMVGLGQEHEL